MADNQGPVFRPDAAGTLVAVRPASFTIDMGDGVVVVAAVCAGDTINGLAQHVLSALNVAYRTKASGGSP